MGMSVNTSEGVGTSESRVKVSAKQKQKQKPYVALSKTATGILGAEAGLYYSP